MVEEIKAIDLDEAEAIGKGLQERQRDKPTEEPSDFETWDNEHFRERVREILLAGKMMDVDISKIRIPEQGLAKYQFRRTRPDRYGSVIDGDEGNDDLKESIKANGVLEPIILQQKEDYFNIIDGHSRFLFWRQALAEVPDLPKPTFLVLDCPDTMAMQLAAELNRNGQNLNGEDASVLIIRLYEEGKMKQADIVGLTQRSKSYVSEVISAFREVPAEARALIESGAWKVRHGRELARLVKYPKEQERIMRQAIQTKYNAEIMEEKVDSELAKMKWQQEAEKALKKADIQSEVEGEEIGKITTGQVEKIHDQVLKETTEHSFRHAGAPHRVKKVGKGEYEPTAAATKKILKNLGYEVVEGEAPETKTTPEKPVMPNNDQLMEENGTYASKCPICGGRTHPLVAEEIGFKTQSTWENGKYGFAHVYCRLLDEIEDHKRSIASLEKRLAKDDLALLIKSGQSLEDINNRSHQLYKDELERRKQEWREKNLPKKPAKKAEPAPEKKQEPVSEQPETTEELVEWLHKAQPTLVPSEPHDYWDAFLKFQQQAEGYESVTAVAKTLGVAQPSVSRQFSKLEKAVEEVRA